MESDASFKTRKDTIDRTLAGSLIAGPLANAMGLAEERSGRNRPKTIDPGLPSDPPPQRFNVIIEINSLFVGGREAARGAIRGFVQAAAGENAAEALKRDDQCPSTSYVFAVLSADEIMDLLRLDGETARRSVSDGAKETEHPRARAIFKVWDSPLIGPLTTKSIRTVKADAAQTAFSASGLGIVWAVMDSGIDQNHPHFHGFENLKLDLPLDHKSFVGMDPLSDPFGHGTHVAGIIAGQSPHDGPATIAEESSDVPAGQKYHLTTAPLVRGMAPQCKLMSLQILNSSGGGDVTAMLQALEYIQQLNGYGKMIVVQGVNISAGYPFDAQWYACGQTPICAEVDRLVRSGVVVVAAAGNTGHVTTAVNTGGGVVGTFEAGQSMSINDPGNADLAITVGSTDREKPHLYGISYFSSKGPTGDGRCKPDVVAPGEHIISAATGANVTKVPAEDVGGETFDYVQDTGTSMAAPHVSGIVAGFLSIRSEFIGRAVEMRDLVISSALDLKRDKNLQGAGLVDLMRLIESV